MDAMHERAVTVREQSLLDVAGPRVEIPPDGERTVASERVRRPARALGRAIARSAGWMGAWAGTVALVGYAVKAIWHSPVNPRFAVHGFEVSEHVVLSVPAIWIAGFALLGGIMAVRGTTRSRRAQLVFCASGVLAASLYALAARGAFAEPVPDTIKAAGAPITSWPSLIFAPAAAALLPWFVGVGGMSFRTRWHRLVVPTGILGLLLRYWSLPIWFHVAGRKGSSPELMVRGAHEAGVAGTALLALAALGTVLAAVGWMLGHRGGGSTPERSTERDRTMWYGYGALLTLGAFASYLITRLAPNRFVSLETLVTQALCALAPMALLLTAFAAMRSRPWPAGKSARAVTTAVVVAIVSVLHVMADVAVRGIAMGHPGVLPSPAREGDVAVMLVAAIVIGTVVEHAVEGPIRWAIRRLQRLGARGEEREARGSTRRGA